MSARQKSIVQGRITDGTLFPNISVSISSAMVDIVAKIEKDLRRGLESALSHIESDFQLALEKHREESAEGQGPGGGQEMADEIVSWLIGEVEQLQQAHARLLETVD